MIGDWIDASEAIAFAKGIARDVVLLFPVNPQKGKPASTKADLKRRKKLDALIGRTHAFARTHKLNVYKKAKFLNTLKWELREAGHEDAFIDEIVTLLASTLA